MAGLTSNDPSGLQVMGLLGGLNLMQPNAAAAAAMMPPQDTAAAVEAAAAAAAASSAAAAAAAAAAVGVPAAPRSRAALRQHLLQEYERAGLTRRLTSVDLQVCERESCVLCAHSACVDLGCCLLGRAGRCMTAALPADACIFWVRRLLKRRLLI